MIRQNQMGNFLNVINALARLRADELKRVVAMCVASGITRIPKEYFLTMLGSEAACGRKVFPLDVMHDGRALSVQKVGNDNAYAFTRARWRKAENMLGTVSYDETISFASE